MYVFDKPKLQTAFLTADVATVEPLPDLAQDRRPTVRTNSPPHGSPVPHDLKTSGSSDYAYTYSGMGLWGRGEATGLEHDLSPSEHIAVVRCVFNRLPQNRAGSVAVTLKTVTQGLVVRIPGYSDWNFCHFPQSLQVNVRTESPLRHDWLLINPSPLTIYQSVMRRHALWGTDNEVKQTRKERLSFCIL